MPGGVRDGRLAVRVRPRRRQDRHRLRHPRHPRRDGQHGPPARPDRVRRQLRAGQRDPGRGARLPEIQVPSAAKNAAFLYLNAGAAAANAKSWIAGWKQRGFTFTYTEGIETSEFNYSPYVTQMKNKGVKYVQFLGSYQHAVRLATAMRQQGFKPDVFLLDPTGYNINYVKSGGSAVEGTRVFTNSATFEDPQTAEMRLYRGWLERVAPGATPSYFGLFAWSAARLFTEQALKLGGKLTRKSLIAAVAKVRAWNGHGLFAPQDVGGKHTAGCNSIIRLKHGKWVRESKRYLCGAVVNTGVSG
ncbi:MAG: ABC transporter substrate-binding protein [Micromonosporaceae bacterium]|nr:ABC transporter substrate-binding protein [Micromonosporaceae bacterium]